MDLDPAFIRTFNAVLAGLYGVVLIVVTIVTAGPASSYRRADRVSLQLQLPYAGDATRDAIAAWVRRSARWVLGAAVAGVVVVLAVLTTPLGEQYEFIFVVTIPVLLIVTTAAGVAASVRERLFHPAPDVPRVARARAMSARDYFGPVRRLAPWVFGAILAVSLALLAVAWPGDIAPAPAGAALAVAGFAVVAQAIRPLLNRLVLDRPQPAADTLELAWDDAIRTDALASIALLTCQLSGLGAALVVLAVVGDASPVTWIFMQVPTWALIVPQILYLGWQGRRPLRPALYPEWLRSPLPAGGIA